MRLIWTNPVPNPKFPVAYLGEKVWDDFAKGDDHVVSAENREVPDLSAILFDNNKKSRHEPDFEKSNYAADNLIPGGHDHNSVLKDLTFHEWPDIDNFEDVERMFRNCDSTFGQSHVSCVGGISWLASSSNTVDGSGASNLAALSSSCPELGLPNDTLEESYAKTMCFPKFDPSATDATSASVDCHSNSGCLGNDAEVEGISVSKEQIKSQYSSEDDAMQRCLNQMVPTSAVTTHTDSFQYFPERNRFFGCPSSSYLNNFNSHAQVDYSFPADRIPQTQSTSSSVNFENETHHMTSFEHFPYQSSTPPAMPLDLRMEKLPEKQSYAPVLMEHCHHDAVRNKSSVLKNKSLHATASESSQELDSVPIAGRKSTIGQQNSLVRSVSSDDISAEAMSFQQLWHVMDQLDDGTKCCIRDSLYRLARSTIPRNVLDRSNSCRGSMDESKILGAAVWPSRCAEIKVETATNPIDRSVAHLLFQRPPVSFKSLIKS
ncbi:protein LNK1-like isoform X1 [Musa acuminata AAA Group]|uniref:protein LNK1-like isoform X1 n=2 Tax=Musa acuminata AAA Group TaxID=214697 RepID=UPI0031E01503